MITIIPSENFLLEREVIGRWAVKRYVHWYGRYDSKQVFIKFRKKHNRTWAEVATHQFFADELKPIFGLIKVGMVVVWNPQQGVGIMQNWIENIGTVKQLPVSELSAEVGYQLIKIILYDCVIGSLDRHGNNVLVRPDRKLVCIDDEDIFYNDNRVLVKFDKHIKELIKFIAVNCPVFCQDAINHINASKPAIIALCAEVAVQFGWRSIWLKILSENLESVWPLFSAAIDQCDSTFCI